MAFVVKDRVKTTTATTGTGPVTLGAAPSGYQDFSVIGDGNSTYYAIVDSATGQWEVGIGTYTVSTMVLTRDTVLESTNANALVNFSAGLKDVFVTYPAETSVSTQSVGIVTPAMLSTGAPTWNSSGDVTVGSTPAASYAGYRVLSVGGTTGSGNLDLVATNGETQNIWSDPGSLNFNSSGNVYYWFAGFGSPLAGFSSDGKFGAGTTTPSARLESSQNIAFGTGGTYGAGQIYSDANYGVIIRAKQASPALQEFSFKNATDVTRFYVNTSGDFVSNGNITATGISLNSLNAAVGIFRNQVNSTGGPTVWNLAGSNGTSYVIAGSDLGAWIATSAALYQGGGAIVSSANTAHTASSAEGNLRFWTTPSGSLTQVERIRIEGDGSRVSTIPGTSTLLPDFPCRAWVNFNAVGTVTINASGNVSSISDNGVGWFSLNFTTAMPDKNYSVAGTASKAAGGVSSSNSSFVQLVEPASASTAGFQFLVVNLSAAVIDCEWNNVSVFR